MLKKLRLRQTSQGRIAEDGSWEVKDGSYLCVGGVIWDNLLQSWRRAAICQET
jgi:hypothetical protein